MSFSLSVFLTFSHKTIPFQNPIPNVISKSMFSHKCCQSAGLSAVRTLRQINENLNGIDTGGRE